MAFISIQRSPGTWLLTNTTVQALYTWGYPSRRVHAADKACVFLFTNLLILHCLPCDS